SVVGYTLIIVLHYLKNKLKKSLIEMFVNGQQVEAALQREMGPLRQRQRLVLELLVKEDAGAGWFQMLSSRRLVA
ncbi:MAG: hypothetical protein QF831_04565, partial [Candidatus Thalassarchaeaceae archaeon]|nr:hypothetical protein [Candidatus Thalassarchaeaceae archaeon]